MSDSQSLWPARSPVIWVSCSQNSYRVALPNEHAAVSDNFGANEKARWFRKKGRAAEYLSRGKPEKHIFWPPGAMKKY